MNVGTHICIAGRSEDKTGVVKSEWDGYAYTVALAEGGIMRASPHELYPTSVLDFVLLQQRIFDQVVHFSNFYTRTSTDLQTFAVSDVSIQTFPIFNEKVKVSVCIDTQDVLRIYLFGTLVAQLLPLKGRVSLSIPLTLPRERLVDVVFELGKEKAFCVRTDDNSRTYFFSTKQPLWLLRIPDMEKLIDNDIVPSIVANLVDAVKFAENAGTCILYHIKQKYMTFADSADMSCKVLSMEWDARRFKVGRMKNMTHMRLYTMSRMADEEPECRFTNIRLFPLGIAVAYEGRKTTVRKVLPNSNLTLSCGAIDVPPSSVDADTLGFLHTQIIACVHVLQFARRENRKDLKCMQILVSCMFDELKKGADESVMSLLCLHAHRSSSPFILPESVLRMIVEDAVSMGCMKANLEAIIFALQVLNEESASLFMEEGFLVVQYGEERMRIFDAGVDPRWCLWKLMRDDMRRPNVVAAYIDLMHVMASVTAGKVFAKRVRPPAISAESMEIATKVADENMDKLIEEERADRERAKKRKDKKRRKKEKRKVTVAPCEEEKESDCESADVSFFGDASDAAFSADASDAAFSADASFLSLFASAGEPTVPLSLQREDGFQTVTNSRSMRRVRGRNDAYANELKKVSAELEEERAARRRVSEEAGALMQSLGRAKEEARVAREDKHVYGALYCVSRSSASEERDNADKLRAAQVEKATVEIEKQIRFLFTVPSMLISPNTMNVDFVATNITLKKMLDMYSIFVPGFSYDDVIRTVVARCDDMHMEKTSRYLSILNTHA